MPTDVPPQGVASEPRTPSRKAWLSPILAVPLLIAAGLGLLGGWLWWSWWGPPPDGRIYETQVGPQWYPEPFDPGITRDFSGTATYVVIGFALALLLGALGAVLCRRIAVAGLVAVFVASVAAAAVMAVVGLSQSPSDPQDRAGVVEIGTELPGHLDVAMAEIALPEWFADAVGDDDGVLKVATPYLAWPVGAMLGYFVVMVSILTRSPQD